VSEPTLSRLFRQHWTCTPHQLLPRFRVEEAERLLAHRFTKGTFKGHNAGNIILAALEREFNDFEEAITYCGRLFSLRGTIHPSTLTPVTLIARDGRQTIAGQSVIHTRNLTGRVTLTLEPRPRANPKAVEAILAADVLVFAPGDWFSSLLPNFLIPDIRKAINASEAVKIHICNLMTSKKHTYGWSVRTFRKQLEKALHGSVDYTVYNTKFPKSARAKSSFDDNWSFVEIDKNLDKCYIQGELLCDTLVQKSRGDMLARNPVRHDEHVLGNIIMRLVEHHHD